MENLSDTYLTNSRDYIIEENAKKRKKGVPEEDLEEVPPVPLWAKYERSWKSLSAVDSKLAVGLTHVYEWGINC